MSAIFNRCGGVHSEACPEKQNLHAVQCFIFAHVGTGRSSVEVDENFPLQWQCKNGEDYLLDISLNKFEGNAFSIDEFLFCTP